MGFMFINMTLFFFFKENYYKLYFSVLTLLYLPHFDRKQGESVEFFFENQHLTTSQGTQSSES